MAPRPHVLLLFAGIPETGESVFLEAVYGFELARRRMRQIAKQRPGAYFLCELGAHEAIDQIYGTATQVQETSRCAAASK